MITDNIKIIKRDGRKSTFDSTKISNAIKKAAEEVQINLPLSHILGIAQQVLSLIENELDGQEVDYVSVEEVQDMVERVLSKGTFRNPRLKAAYSEYRKERTEAREKKSSLMKAIKEIGIQTDKDNANIGNNFSAKLLRIASESNKWQNLAAMPKHLAKVHENGDMHIHDLDSFNLTINCLYIPTKEILETGINTGYGKIRKPKRIESAAELSCILLQASQNDLYGGQAHADFDNDISEYVEYTRKEIQEEYSKFNLTEEELLKVVEDKLKQRVKQAMQAVVYNLNTMHSRAGSQVAFSSINIGLPTSENAALVCEMLLLEYEKGLGLGETPIFPNIIFRVKDGVNKKSSDPYHYLFKIATRVASKRMNPTFMNIDADFNKEYYDKGYVPATMGCRTCLISNVNGEPGVKGRGNIAPITINLPRLGILANGNISKFYALLDEKLEIARESLIYRYNILKKLKVKDLPFVAGQKLYRGSEKLKPDDSIEPLLKQGSYSIGFIGLAETLTALLGNHHGESDEAQKLGLEIISHIRRYTDAVTKKSKLNFATYATPAEGLSGKFIAKDKKIFGIIDGVTDKDYYTNSFHVPVAYPIGIQKKIDIEAPYHKKCNSGHITYIEIDDYPSEEVVMDILNYAYNTTNINYMGINFHIKYCKSCGTYLKNNENVCPRCKGKDIQGVSRVTGYLSLDERFGDGKSAERADRLSHNGEENINNY